MEYICSFCGARLILETIENIKIFRRQEERWTKKDGALKRIFNVIRNPSRAFWDISHEKDSKGPFLILLFNALILGLWAGSIYIHLNIALYRGNALTLATFYIGLIQGLSVFMIYFLFGLFYFTFIFLLWCFLFKIGANFATNINNLIAMRYSNDDKTKGKASVSSQQVQTSAKKEITDKLNPKKPGTYKIMMYAYAPLIVTNLIATLLIVIAIPTINIANTSLYSNISNYTVLMTLLEPIFDSWVWSAVDVLYIVTLIGWIPITMSIALRDLANTSTTKLYIACVVIGFIISYTMYFLRPTLGWNFNLIEQYRTTTTTTTTTSALGLLQGLIGMILPF
jgi:hypothetical protein